LILSDTLARHRKPPRSSAAGSGKPPRRGKLSAIVSPFRHPVRIAVVAVVGLAALVAAWPAAAHWMARESNPTWVQEADALGLQMAGSLGLQVREQPEVVSEGVAVAPIYLNPLRNVNELVLERVDQGVDFSGTGPVYALGDGIVTSATGDAGGWPGGGWITYQLTNGPGQGLIVYVAEDITPSVQVGQYVTPSTVLGYMFEGGDGIETGWAALNGLAASELSEAAATGDAYAFPTASGINFDELLQSLGVPPAPNFDQPASGYLPANYPTSW
jgi:murein DD-endopeptidase MepM/ murein hydrolase activator NlpD